MPFTFAAESCAPFCRWPGDTSACARRPRAHGRAQGPAWRRGHHVTVRRTARRGLTTVAGIAAAGLVAAATAQTAVAEPGSAQSGTEKAPQAQLANDKIKKPTPKDKLGQHDRELLARAVQRGDKRVTVILATEKGATASVVKSIQAAGGWTSMVSDRVGYVSASVPTGQVDSLAKSAAILAVDLNESIPLPKPETAQAGAAPTAAVAGPGAEHARRQPLHADPRHRVGRVQGRPQRLGRPRRHDRRHRLGCRPRPPGPAEDHHRRAQDRRLGHRAPTRCSRATAPGAPCSPP